MIKNAKEKLKILKMVAKEGLKVKGYINNDKLLEELIEKYQEKNELRDRLFRICTSQLNDVKVEINLKLYCLFVNSLSKTTDKKFDEVKKRLRIWIKFLKEMFYEFDKNDIHKDHTFIFDCCSDYYQHCYELNGKEYIANRDKTGGLRCMFLTDVEFDNKQVKPENIFMRTDPEIGEYENYYESELGRDLVDAHSKFHRLKYIYENVNKKDPRYKSFNFCEVLKYMLFETGELTHKL